MAGVALAGLKRLKPQHCRAYWPSDPQAIARPRAAARWYWLVRGAPNRGQPQTARTIGADSVAAEQGGIAIVLQSRLKSPQERGILVVFAQLIGQQHTDRMRAFGGKIRHIAGHQLPGQILTRLAG